MNKQDATTGLPVIEGSRILIEDDAQAGHVAVLTRREVSRRQQPRTMILDELVWLDEATGREVAPQHWRPLRRGDVTTH
ncbi:hypothetical protein M0638_03375 [Roseomonas sp. NAR14]|uniref:Uncharacterized protein n=1 Tax=Roseomonas acroporae TaxID=2937791 RepID=A0A9X1Y4T0_9PROT|nr:hypothetical protein [Roseomonas acroporae]MCK8783423.1 hypothetical protein [Roseomonas acroporae]